MIQLIFDSTDEILPEWENEQERLIFRLAPANVSLGKLLHGRVASREAGGLVPDDEALGTQRIVVATEVREPASRNERKSCPCLHPIICSD